MLPDFQREFIRQDFAKRGQTIDAEDVTIIGSEKVDDMLFVGYALPAGGRSWDYGLVSFREYYGGYIFIHRYPCFSLDIPELAHYDVMTNYAIGSQGKQGYYQVFLSQAENLRQVKLFYTSEDFRSERPDKSWQLLEELTVLQCPTMLIMSDIRPPEGSRSGSYRTYYAFFDENGEEIACLDGHHSYSNW